MAVVAVSAVCVTANIAVNEHVEIRVDNLNEHTVYSVLRGSSYLNEWPFKPPTLIFPFVFPHIP